MSPSTGKVALYGATGFTGRLVAHELRRRGIATVISGRSEQKLEQLAAELGGEVEIRAARTDDPASLRSLLVGCDAVINCAGPFTSLGEPVVAAAIARTGTHYVDTTGEQLYINRIFNSYGSKARAAGVTVVPAIGFDFLPGDMAANIAGSGIDQIDELTVAYFVTGMRATHGTLLSGLEIMRSGRLLYENQHLRKAPWRGSVRKFAFPDPIGLRPTVDYPSGEVLTVPRHTPTRKMTALLSATAFGPESAAPVLPAITTLMSLLARTPAIGLLRAGVRRMPEGPTDAQREQVRYTIVAQATSGQTTRRTIVRGGDVYGITAVIVAEAAERMIDDGYDRSGVLAPSEAWDPESFLAALAEHGVEYEAPLEATAGSPA